MQLHELKSNTYRKKPKRVGRGGKRGTTSGRGQKGQKSRSGHRIRPAERYYIQRLPKLRGYKNRKLEKSSILNVGDLEARFNGTVVDPKTLPGVSKILGNGELKKA